MDHVRTTVFDEIYIKEERNKNRGKIEKRMKIDQDSGSEDDDAKFKSKNLKAERRRRKKLSDRQLELRSLVPIITNARTLNPQIDVDMNKATIITDAISYIEELQKNVKDLSDQLHEMEATCAKDERRKSEESNTKPETKIWGIAPEVHVIHIDGNKLWIKMIFEKKRRGLTRLIEAMSVLGFDLTDTSVTTSNGAVLVTSSVEGIRGGHQDAEQIKEFLIETINSI